MDLDDELEKRKTYSVDVIVVEMLIVRNGRGLLTRKNAELPVNHGRDLSSSPRRRASLKLSLL